MSSTRPSPTSLQDQPLAVRARLAAAWTSFMFLYVYADVLGFYQPGVIDDILAGRVWEFDVTQAWAVGAFALMAVPILMVVLSTTLPARGGRVTNLAVASVYVVVSAGNAIGETWTVFYGLTIGLEVAVLTLIIRDALTWSRTAHASTGDRGSVGSRPGDAGQGYAGSGSRSSITG